MGSLVSLISMSESAGMGWGGRIGFLLGSNLVRVLVVYLTTLSLRLFVIQGIEMSRHNLLLARPCSK